MIGQLPSMRRFSPVVLWVCVLVVVGFHLRSVFLWETVPEPPAIRADALDYYMYAHNMRHQHVYSRDAHTLMAPDRPAAPDAERSPGYPLLILPFMWTDSPGSVPARVLFAQVLMSSLTVIVAFRLYRGFLPIAWAGVAATLTALSPHLISMNIYLLTETLFTFLLVLAVSVASPPVSTFRAATLGCLLGLACLVRPVLHAFAPVAALWSIRSKEGKLTNGVALLLGFLIVIAPWAARNALSLGRISDERLQINFLHHGSYPDFMYEGRPETFGYPYRFDPRAAEIGSSMTSVLSEIVDRFRREPLRTLEWYSLTKPMAFWSWNIVQGQGDVFVYHVLQSPYDSDPVFVWSHRVMKSIHLFLVGLSALGCALVWVPAVSGTVHPPALTIARFLSLILVYMTLLHMIGAPFPRYSVPLRPLMYGMAAFAAALVTGGFRRFAGGRPEGREPA